MRFSKTEAHAFLLTFVNCMVNPHVVTILITLGTSFLSPFALRFAELLADKYFPKKNGKP